jgi:hypothetical protein
MEEYLKKFFEYQDDLFWGRDIDSLDLRIKMWLDSKEGKKAENLVKNHGVSHHVSDCPKCKGENTCVSPDGSIWCNRCEEWTGR